MDMSRFHVTEPVGITTADVPAMVADRISEMLQEDRNYDEASGVLLLETDAAKCDGEYEVIWGESLPFQRMKVQLRDKTLALHRLDELRQAGVDITRWVLELRHSRYAVTMSGGCLVADCGGFGSQLPDPQGDTPFEAMHKLINRFANGDIMKLRPMADWDWRLLETELVSQTEHYNRMNAFR